MRLSHTYTVHIPAIVLVFLFRYAPVWQSSKQISFSSSIVLVAVFSRINGIQSGYIFSLPHTKRTHDFLWGATKNTFVSEIRQNFGHVYDKYGFLWCTVPITWKSFRNIFVSLPFFSSGCCFLFQCFKLVVYGIFFLADAVKIWTLFQVTSSWISTHTQLPHSTVLWTAKSNDNKQKGSTAISMAT